MKKWYIFECSDGSKFRVPVEIIAKNRAKYYAENDDDFDGDFEKSLNEDTIPLFESDTYEIEDWARNSMNWVDVRSYAETMTNGGLDMTEEWTNPEETDFSD